MEGIFIATVHLLGAISEDAQYVLETLADYLQQSNIFWDALRSYEWSFIKMYASWAEAGQYVYSSVLSCLGIFSSSSLTGLLKDYRVAYDAMIALSLVIVGVIYMFSEKRPPLLLNIGIWLAVVWVMPYALDLVNEAVTADVTEEGITSSLEPFVYDVEAAVLFGGRDAADYITSMEDSGISDFDDIDINEVVSPKDKLIKEDALAKQVFSYKRTAKLGRISYEEIKDSWLDYFDPPYYYRWKFDMVGLNIVLSAELFLYIFAAYKVLMILYEIIVTRVLVTVSSAYLSGNQKTVKLLENLLSCYIILYVIAFSVRLYGVMVAYIGTLTSNPVIRAIAAIILAFAVLQGPNIVQKMFGIDAGFNDPLSKVTRGLQTTLMMSQSAAMLGYYRRMGRAAGETGGFRSHTVTGNPTPAPGGTGSPGATEPQGTDPVDGTQRHPADGEKRNQRSGGQASGDFAETAEGGQKGSSRSGKKDRFAEPPKAPMEESGDPAGRYGENSSANSRKKSYKEPPKSAPKRTGKRRSSGMERYYSPEDDAELERRLLEESRAAAQRKKAGEQVTAAAEHQRKNPESEKRSAEPAEGKNTEKKVVFGVPGYEPSDLDELERRLLGGGAGRSIKEERSGNSAAGIPSGGMEERRSYTPENRAESQDMKGTQSVQEPARDMRYSTRTGRKTERKGDDIV